MGKVARERREARGILNPRAWTPFREVTPSNPVDADGYTMFQNSRYTVLVGELETPIGPCVHLSIRHNNRHFLRDWRDFQRIKNELVGPEAEAAELYPAESRLVDGANQFHLWAFMGRFPFGFTERSVAGPEDDPSPETAATRQRPLEGGDNDPE